MMINLITCTLKILIHLCFIKQKIKKNVFYSVYSCLQCFSSENALIKHKEDCLSINGQQSINLEIGTIELKIILNSYQLHLKFMLILSLI